MIITTQIVLFVQHIPECVMGRLFKCLLMLTTSEALNKFNQLDSRRGREGPQGGVSKLNAGLKIRCSSTDGEGGAEE